MSAARKFRKLRDRERMREAMERGKTRLDAIHTTVNPPGSKLLKQFFRAKHGCRPTGDKDTTPLQEAREWYANLYQPKYRQGRDPQRDKDALHAYVAALQARRA